MVLWDMERADWAESGGALVLGFGCPQDNRWLALSQNYWPSTATDRVISTIGGVAGLISVLGLLPSYVLGVVLIRLELFPAIALWLLPAYIVWDLCSLYMIVARLVRGRGPSSVPLLSLCYYAIFSLSGIRGSWWWRTAVFAGLTLFHFSCHMFVPSTVRKRLRREAASARGDKGSRDAH